MCDSVCACTDRDLVCAAAPRYTSLGRSPSAKRRDGQVALVVLRSSLTATPGSAHTAVAPDESNDDNVCLRSNSARMDGTAAVAVKLSHASTGGQVPVTLEQKLQQLRASFKKSNRSSHAGFTICMGKV